MIEIKTKRDTESFAISTRLLMRQALKKGYLLYYFPAAPSGETGVTRAVKGKKELFFKSTCALSTPFVGFASANDKVQTYSLLSSYGINMPDTHVLTKDDKINARILKRYEEVVVKPADTNHGEGITVGVRSESKLKDAVALARQAGVTGDVLIQQQVYGTEYRFLVVDGKVVAVAHRRPPFVVGDGHLTVRELLEEKNKDPRRGEEHTAELTLINLEEVEYHKGKEFLAHVPEKGKEVSVLDTSNLSKGGESVDFTDKASGVLKRLAVDAAAKCFLPIAGVDIITNDITAETDEGSYVIEVNVSPGLRMHQFPTEGKPRDVAKLIFKAMEKTGRPVGRVIRRVGRVEPVRLPDLLENKLPARIDTGATMSSLWASNIQETSQGLSFTLLDASHPEYTGKRFVTKEFGLRAVSSSMGHIQTRYQVRLRLVIKGRRKMVRFTLANRSTQMYPILIGRNVLRNSFVVDVTDGRPDWEAEKGRREALDAAIQGKEESV